MIYLTIDVSSYVIVGLCKVDGAAVTELVALRSADARHHVENLAPMVHEALAQADLVKPDAVIVGTGPAAFTGLRAGLITARALARAWNVPIHGVSSLEVLALAGADAGANFITPLIDARRKEIYALQARAMGADDIEVMQEVAVLKPAELVETLAVRPSIVACADEQLYLAEFPERVTVDCAPAVMTRLYLSRQARVEAGESFSFDTEPQYLRRPDVHPGKGTA